VILELTSKRSFRNDAAAERNDNYEVSMADAFAAPQASVQDHQPNGEV
jgi:hypothetical protein